MASAQSATAVQCPRVGMLCAVTQRERFLDTGERCLVTHGFHAATPGCNTAWAGIPGSI